MLPTVSVVTRESKLHDDGNGLLTGFYRSTLKVFRRGEASEYGGSRKTDGIVSYMRK